MNRTDRNAKENIRPASASAKFFRLRE